MKEFIGKNINFDYANDRTFEYNLVPKLNEDYKICGVHLLIMNKKSHK